MRFFHQKGLLARRSYRASLPATLMGLATFSLVLVLFGGVVYAAAVPALIVQNPVIQSVVESVTASRDESADAADSSSQSSGSKSFSSGPVASSNSGAYRFPASRPWLLLQTILIYRQILRTKKNPLPLKSLRAIPNRERAAPRISFRLLVENRVAETLSRLCNLAPMPMRKRRFELHLLAITTI